MMSPEIRKAIDKAGGPVAVARRLGVKHQAVSAWRQVPPARVRALAKIIRLSPAKIRPDLYGRE